MSMPPTDGVCWQKSQKKALMLPTDRIESESMAPSPIFMSSRSACAHKVASTPKRS